MDDSGSVCTRPKHSRRILSSRRSPGMRSSDPVQSARPRGGLQMLRSAPRCSHRLSSDAHSDLFLPHKSEYLKVVGGGAEGLQPWASGSPVASARSERTRSFRVWRFPSRLSHLTANRPVSEVSIGSGFAAAGCSSVDRRLILCGLSAFGSPDHPGSFDTALKAATYPPTDGLSSSAI